MGSNPETIHQAPLRRIGRYSLIEDLAKGGMAQVYVAQKDGAPEICVLKRLLGELESHATAGKRFYREAHVACYLDHPNIARTTDAGPEDGAFCIAMEFISGKDIESMMHLLMRQGRMLPYELSISVALAVLDGLAYAHDARDPSGKRLDLVHRDLSPRNVMLGFDGQVKIIDFGLARGQLDDFKTAPGMVLGTLRYVSPEQAVAEPVDRKSDLYSISVVLYEMLSGRPLVRDGKPLEVLTAVVNEVAPPISSINPHLPRALDAVLARALDKDPNARWPDARAYRDALLAAAGDLALVPKEALGTFVRQLFPQDVARAERLIAEGRRRYAQQMRSRAQSLYPPTERTRGEVALSELDPFSDATSRTRTGFVPDDGEDTSQTRATQLAKTRILGDDAVIPTVFDPLRDGADTQAVYMEYTEPGGPAGETVLTPTALVNPGARPRPAPASRARMLTAAFGLLAAVVVVGLTAVILQDQDAEVVQIDAVELAPEVPIAAPGAVGMPAAPAASPRIVPAPDPAPSAPPAEKAAAAKTRRPAPARAPAQAEPAREAAPAPPPPAKRAPDGLATLRRKITELARVSESNGALDQVRFEEILRLVKAAAAELPPAEKRQVMAKVQTAETFLTIDALQQALVLLEGAER